MPNPKKTKTYGKGSRPAGGYRERKQSVIDRLEEAGRTSGKSARQVKNEEEVDAVFELEVETEPENKDWWDELFGD